jgi:hypothetical protein
MAAKGGSNQVSINRRVGEQIVYTTVENYLPLKETHHTARGY